MFKRIINAIKYFSQAIFIYLLYVFLRLLPLSWAAGICAFALRTFGCLTFFNKVAKANLDLVFPEKSDGERNQILHGMWDNLGRTMAEYCHLDALGRNRDNITIKNYEILESLKSNDKGTFFVLGHFANWEIGNIITRNYGITINPVYRAPNNFFVTPLYNIRQKGLLGELIPKGRQGAKRILSLLKEGKNIGILADQKMNTGVSIDLLGHPAMTLDSVAIFALMRKSPILMIQIKRTTGSKFEVTLHKSLEVIDTGDRDNDVRHILQQMNDIYSAWIREAPEQWLWIHDRWGLKKRGLIK